MRNTFESPPRARDFEQGCRHHGCPGERRITSSPYPSYGKSMDMEDPPFRDLLMLANISKCRIPATCAGVLKFFPGPRKGPSTSATWALQWGHGCFPGLK